MNNLDKKYTELLTDILENGTQKEDRTGTGTISVFGRQIRHSFKDGKFPLITTKKVPFGLVVTELLWFLRGDTNIKYLVDNNCHIWTGDAYKVYDRDFDREHPPFSAPYPRRLTVEEFEEKIMNDDEFNELYGDLGPIYGKQWRAFGGYEKEPSGWNKGAVTHYKDIPVCDQISNLINDLKTNPDSRRLMVSAWNPSDLSKQVLPPCHYGFQVYTRELSVEERLEWVKVNLPNIDVNGFVNNDEYGHKWIETLSDNIPTRAISLQWNQRSCDTFLGLPFNIASYGLLLEIIAKAVNMVPDELIGNLGDTHLYLNHVEQAKEQIGRELSLEERKSIYEKEYTDGIKVQNDEWLESKLKTRNIPIRTREPYPLPTLKHMKTGDFYKSLSEDLSLITHLDANDFVLENYKSHPTIKAPLSN